MQNSLISVIIPVFNAEKSIKKCIESVLNQSYKNIEIIAINDGSKDNTLEILKNFKSQIILIDQQNSGVSAARNAGLNIAKGEFVAFLDSDDCFEIDFLKLMLEAALKNDADIVVCDVLIKNEGKNSIFKDINANYGLIDPDFYLKLLLTNQNSMGWVWNKIFKKEILKDVRFNTNLILAEDQNFVTDAILNSKIVYKLDKILYNYDVIYKKFVYKHFQNGLQLYEANVKNLKKFKKFDAFKDEVFFVKIYNYLCFVLSKSNFDKKDFKNGLNFLVQDIKNIVKSPYFENLNMKFRLIFLVIFCLKNKNLIYIFLSALNSKMSKFILKKFI